MTTTTHTDPHDPGPLPQAEQDLIEALAAVCEGRATPLLSCPMCIDDPVLGLAALLTNNPIGPLRGVTGRGLVISPQGDALEVLLLTCGHLLP